MAKEEIKQEKKMKKLYCEACTGTAMKLPADSPEPSKDVVCGSCGMKTSTRSENWTEVK